MSSTSVRAIAQRPPIERPGDCAVSGTAAGLAAHLGWTVTGVRAIFVLLTLVGGAGALLYVWIWMLTPRRTADRSPSRRVPVAWILTGMAGVGALATVGQAQYVVFAGGGSVSAGWAGAVIVAGACAVGAGMWATFVDRTDPSRGPRHELAVRLAATGILLTLVVCQLVIMQSSGLMAFLLAVALTAGIGLVFSSTLIEKWRGLAGERVRRIREEQRSEMAAHLHDSVLQTLALIQNRSGASSEVARLARAQERELRSWLYDGDSPADSDLATDLRDYAGALELDYPVRIDIVSAGLSTERASGDVAAAAREAMLNAARHAGGEVAVYIEGAASGVEVFVRDRGAGFDPASVPSDRLGVRESIVGRMRRAGGTATVKPGAGGVGTEVHLRLVQDEAHRG